MVTLSQGFSFLVLTFWAEKFFVVGGCPVHCRVFSSIFDLDPLDASSTPHPSNKNQRCLQMLSPEGQNCSQLRITASKAYAHNNLTTEGKYSLFVTEHVPWTESTYCSGWQKPCTQ